MTFILSTIYPQNNGGVRVLCFKILLKKHTFLPNPVQILFAYVCFILYCFCYFYMCRIHQKPFKEAWYSYAIFENKLYSINRFQILASFNMPLSICCCIVWIWKNVLLRKSELQFTCGGGWTLHVLWFWLQMQSVCVFTPLWSDAVCIEKS